MSLVIKSESESSKSESSKSEKILIFEILISKQLIVTVIKICFELCLRNFELFGFRRFDIKFAIWR